MFIESARILAAVVFTLAPLAARTSASTNACEPASTALVRAKDLLAQKQYAEATRSLDQLRNCTQLGTPDQFELGWLYGRARHFDTALKIFDQVPADFPDRLTHDYAVALSKFELTDYRGAVSILEALRSSGSSDSPSANLLAVCYSKLGLYKEAFAVLAEQVHKDPKDLPSYLNLITVCAEGGDLAKAGEIAARAATEFPQSPEVLIVRGAANSLLGRSEQASQDFTTAAQLAPERGDARFFLALMDYNQARYQEALNVIDKAKADGLQDPDLHYLRAEVLLKVDATHSGAALDELNNALRIDPESVAARTLRGRLLLEKGDMKAAEADLEAARRIDPDSRSTLYSLARAYRALGKKEQADALFRQLRSERPDTLKEMGDRRFNEALADKGARQ